MHSIMAVSSMKASTAHLIILLTCKDKGYYTDPSCCTEYLRMSSP